MHGEIYASIGEISAETHETMQMFRGSVDYHRAEELAQEVIIKLWQAKCNGIVIHCGYIRQAVRNKITDEHRRKQFVLVSKSGSEKNKDGTKAPERETPDQITTEDIVLLRELRTEIHYVLSLLPQAYRVVIMDYAVGYKYQEIADRHGIPIGTVKSRLDYAKKRLRKLLKEAVS